MCGGEVWVKVFGEEGEEEGGGGRGGGRGGGEEGEEEGEEEGGGGREYSAYVWCV